MSALTSIGELLLAEAAGNRAAAKPVSDHSLLIATRDGDEAAFAELVERYRNPITNFIYRMISDYETSVDLSQETFLRVFRAKDRYQTSYAFSTYIYSIASNLAISELRRRNRRRLFSLHGLFKPSEATGDICEFDPPDGAPLQDETLVATERDAAVSRAISTLPDKYRTPLILRDIESLSYDEISKVLQLSEGTVKSRISRARGLLREKLRAYI